jgi:hypothetical protein
VVIMTSAQIRSFEQDDLPQVAAMFLKTFRCRTGTAPASLIEHLRDVYFGHPAYDRSIGSLVYLRPDGAVNGFLGAFPQPLRLGGRELRGAVVGSFMVDNPQASPLAGAFLAKRLLNGPQDVSIIDTANRRSLDFQRALDCDTLDLQSLQWTKILEPASYVLSRLEARAGRLPTMPLRPMARLIDRRLAETSRSDKSPTRRHWHDADIDLDGFATIFERFAGEFDLGPAWTREQLLWILDQARRKTAYGSLFIRAVHKNSGEIAGAYLYFGRRRSDAMTLQVLARPETAEAVLASLFAHAAEMGCTVVRGVAQPFLMPGLCRSERVVFRHASGTHLCVRNADLRRSIRSARLLVGGLVGEGWTRLVSDDFTEAEPRGATAATPEYALWPKRRAVPYAPSH